MMKANARMFLLIGAMLTLILVAQLTLFVANLKTRRKAESLLASLRTLKVGTSTLDDAQPILVAFNAAKMPHGNCSRPAIGYGIHIGNKTISYLGVNHSWLLRAGLRPWGVSATLSFADGHLCEFTYTASALLAGGQLPRKDANLTSAQAIEISAQTTVWAVNNEPDTKRKNYQISYLGTLLRGFPLSGRNLGLQVNITSKADPSDLQRALTFDLSCFSSFRGCRTFCQIMPLVSQDALQRHRTDGLVFPEDEIEFPGCAAVYRPRGPMAGAVSCILAPLRATLAD
jgi:hypothetical protein